MMLTIRPFDYSDDDYRQVSAIKAAVFNEPPEPPEEWKHDDQVRNKNYPFYRDMLLRDGLAIAYVETLQSQFAYHPRKYTCNIFVHPEHDAADVRPAVLDHVLERLSGQDVIAIMSGMLDDKVEALRFFADYGFERVAEVKISKLDLTHFDPARFAATVARVRDEGIEIVSLREMQERDPRWRQKLYDLEVTVN